jgi:hypothetical protein
MTSNTPNPAGCSRATARLPVKALPKARIFDPESVGYLLDHVTRYEAARPWLSANGTVVDTTALRPEEVAARIAGGVAG